MDRPTAGDETLCHLFSLPPLVPPSNLPSSTVML
jgi:hypothetical protein